MVITGNIIRREESTIPNHIRNVLKFKKLKAKDKEFILDNFTSELKGEDVYPLNRIFDFDKVIPEPRTEAECPDDCKVNSESHIVVDEARPWFDWYRWHTKYWGTKWGAYDCYTQVGGNYITFVFSTAWLAPYPIYEQLAKKYGFEFEVKYADENRGSNCGIITYNPDAKPPYDPYSSLYEHEAVIDTTRFARRIWNNY